MAILRRLSTLHRNPNVGLLLLSLLWALTTLRPELFPHLIPEDQNPLPALAELFFPCVMLTLAASALALTRHDPWPKRQDLWAPILTGLGLFVIPPLLMSLPKLTTGDAINSYTRTALFTLVPIICLSLEPYISPAPQPPARLALPAALVAVFGASCIFPIPFPNSLPYTLGMCAVVLAATSIAIASCIAKRAASGSTSLPFAAIAGLTAAATFAITSLFQGLPFWNWRPSLTTLSWTSAIELPALLLLFALFRRLAASRLATRYLFAPLIAILAGAALLQLPLTLRTSLGLLLMTAGATYLLFAPATEPDSTQLSLHL